MRTYDDTFSGEKIYPGKVTRSQNSLITQLLPRSNPSLKATPAVTSEYVQSTSY